MGTRNFYQLDVPEGLAAEGVDPGAIRWVEGAPGLGAALLENRTVDAYFGFWSSSLWWLSELGLPAALLRPSAIQPMRAPNPGQPACSQSEPNCRLC